MQTQKKTISAIDDKIAAQLEKLAQLKARKSRMEAVEKMRLVKAARAMDTRRKILLGAYLHEQMRKDASLNADISKRLEKWLTRPEDRALFELDRREEDTPSSVGAG